MNRTSSDRGASTTVERGARAEALADRVLRAAGLAIVERNFRCRAGELDLVARDGETLVFVEVRSRADHRFGGGLAAVPAAKLRRVARVAACYLAIRKPAFTTCRFDVVAITGGDAVHVRDAFRITW